MISIVLKTCCWARLVDMNFQPVVHTSIIIKCFFTNIINIIHFILCFPFQFFFLISWFLLEEYWAFIYPMTRDYQDHFQKISPFQFFSHIFLKFLKNISISFKNIYFPDSTERMLYNFFVPIRSPLENSTDNSTD